MVIAQFVADSKSGAPIIKNRNLRTAYQIEFNDNDGYNSDFTANSEGTFKFNANSAMFDSTANNDSNEEGVTVEGDVVDSDIESE